MQVSGFQRKLANGSPLMAASPVRSGVAKSAEADPRDTLELSLPSPAMHTPCNKGQWGLAVALAPVALVMLAAQLTPSAALAATPVTVANRAYQEPALQHWHPPTDESERTPEVSAAQQESVQRALTEGATINFRTSEGGEVPITLQRTSSGYRYTLRDDSSVKVRFDATYNPDQHAGVIARLIDYHAQQPAQFAFKLREVVFEPSGSWGNVTARREGRLFRFIGAENLNENHFSHEFGHLAGSAIEKAEDSWGQWLMGKYETTWFPGRSHSAPDTWHAAVGQDNRPVSGYANETPGLEEDFAEFWSAYHEAQESGPEAFRTLRELYPARSAVLARSLQRSAS